MVGTSDKDSEGPSSFDSYIEKAESPKESKKKAKKIVLKPSVASNSHSFDGHDSMLPAMQLHQHYQMYH